MPGFSFEVIPAMQAPWASMIVLPIPSPQKRSPFLGTTVNLAYVPALRWNVAPAAAALTAACTLSPGFTSITPGPLVGQSTYTPPGVTAAAVLPDAVDFVATGLAPR